MHRLRSRRGRGWCDVFSWAHPTLVQPMRCSMHALRPPYALTLHEATPFLRAKPYGNALQKRRRDPRARATAETMDERSSSARARVGRATRVRARLPSHAMAAQLCGRSSWLWRNCATSSKTSASSRNEFAAELESLPQRFCVGRGLAVFYLARLDV